MDNKNKKKPNPTAGTHTCMKFSPLTRPSVRSVWIRVLACSLSSSGRSREHTMILLSISGRKCLGAFISRTPLTASVRFLLFRYSVVMLS